MTKKKVPECNECGTEVPKPPSDILAALMKMPSDARIHVVKTIQRGGSAYINKHGEFILQEPVALCMEVDSDAPQFLKDLAETLNSSDRPAFSSEAMTNLLGLSSEKPKKELDSQNN